MKTKNLTLILFMILAAVQLALPLSTIVKYEETLKKGEVFLFKTAPVDPYDAFRGRYVALRLEGCRITNSQAPEKLSQGQMVYASIIVGEQGFAELSKASVAKPAGQAYVKARVQSILSDKIILNLDLDRYYMEEWAAPKAEELYRRHSRGEKKDAYLKVRVKDGFAAAEGLYLGGRRIEDVIKEEAK